MEESLEEQCESSLEVADFSATAEPLEGNWIDDAAAIFHRHGFCILLNALGGQEISDVLQTCLQVEADMLLLDPDRLGCRDAGRYSFGAAAKSGHMLHHPAWQHLLQSRPVLMVLKRVFREGFVFCGGGGDFVLGKTVNYQSLHSDLGPSRVPPECRSDSEPPMISVNFTVQPVTGENGPLRVVPGRRHTCEKSDAPPCFRKEPEVLRQSKLCPLPPGAAIIRDLRLWHGGTPNGSNDTRFLPSVEVMSLKYSQYISGPHSFGYTYCEVCKWHQCCFYYKDRRSCLPESLFETLPMEVQKLCEQIRGDVPVGLRQFARAQRSWEDGDRSSRWKSWRPSSEGSETIHWDRGGGAGSTSYHASYDQRGWRSNDWSEATGSNARSNAGSQRVWTPNASWEDKTFKTENFAISLREGFAAAGTVLAKTLRVTVGVVLIAKGLRFLNFLSRTLERRGGAKLRLLKALPFASAVSKVLWIFQHT